MHVHSTKRDNLSKKGNKNKIITRDHSVSKRRRSGQTQSEEEKVRSDSDSDSVCLQSSRDFNVIQYRVYRVSAAESINSKSVNNNNKKVKDLYDRTTLPAGTVQYRYLYWCGSVTYDRTI